MPSAQRNERLVLAVACVLPTLVTLAYFRLAETLPSAVQQAIYATGKVVQFALPVVWVAWVRREPLRLQRPSTRGLAIGAAFGAAVAVVMGLGYALLLRGTAFFTAASAEVADRIDSIGVASPGLFLLVGLFYALGHSLLEEYYWRWFVFGRGRAVVGLNAAVAISSAAFMAHHVVLLERYFHDTPLVAAALSAAVAVGGVFWAWLYHTSRSLLGPWIGHLIIDAAIFAVAYAMIFL